MSNISGSAFYVMFSTVYLAKTDLMMMSYVWYSSLFSSTDTHFHLCSHSFVEMDDTLSRQREGLGERLLEENLIFKDLNF